MGHGTKARCFRALRVLAVAGAAGCGGGDVWVGELQEGLNLDECAGTDCGAYTAQELATPEPRTCESEVGAALVVDFSVELTEPICTSRSCIPVIQDFAVAPDGSSWLLGYTSGTLAIAGNYSDDPTDRLWVSHFSSEGALLGTSEVAAGVSFNGGSVTQVADLSTDARGHAFVLIYQVDAGPNADAPIAQQAWFNELDTEGRSVNGPIWLAGIAAGKIQAHAEGNVVIAANALLHEPRTVVAKLTGAGERLWSRADLPTASYGAPHGDVDGLHVDASGSSLVLAKRAGFSGGGDGDRVYGVTRYDAAGRVLWDRTIDRRLDVAKLIGGPDGDAVVTAPSWLGYVSADGTVPWTFLLPGDLDSVAFDAERERVYMLTRGLVTDSTELISVSLDGESCERYEVPPGAFGAPTLDGQGRLYLLSEGRLMRLRFPEE